MKKIRKTPIVLIVRAVSFMTSLFGIVFLCASFALAAFGEDVEKPRPVFARDGAAITAKLLPRGKSTSITVRFETTGGDIKDVQALDFASVKGEEINRKDFRCDLFAITLENVPAGGEVTFAARSDFFTSSTRFILFNANATPAWNDAQAGYKLYPDRVRELAFSVKDGGPLDADGTADGKILLNGGPQDSFWGYAIGTLFIRFFGVFLVLGVLMIGMIICGKLFEAADRRKAFKDAASSQQSRAQEPIAPVIGTLVSETRVDEEMAAAIALALHLEMSGAVDNEKALDSSQNAWNLYGRQKIMSDRLQVFKRHSHS